MVGGRWCPGLMRHLVRRRTSPVRRGRGRARAPIGEPAGAGEAEAPPPTGAGVSGVDLAGHGGAVPCETGSGRSASAAERAALDRRRARGEAEDGLSTLDRNDRSRVPPSRPGTQSRHPGPLSRRPVATASGSGVRSRTRASFSTAGRVAATGRTGHLALHSRLAHSWCRRCRESASSTGS